MARTIVPPPPELDWLKLREDMEDGIKPETFSEVFARKMKAQPLVPIGCLATTAALCYGIWNFKKGNSQWSQYMMRTRVVAQGFTICAAVIGTMAASKASQSPNDTSTIKEK